MDFDWKALVRTVAPGIASVFGTPLAGMGVSALLNAILPPDSPQPENAEAFLATQLSLANPEMLLKLKQADHQFALDMERAGVDLRKLDVEDRNSARAREATVRDQTPKILAYMLTAGFFGIMAMLLVHPVPAESKEVLYIMIGSLGTAWIGSMTYYHGSSAGSAAKDLWARMKG